MNKKQPSALAEFISFAILIGLAALGITFGINVAFPLYETWKYEAAIKKDKLFVLESEVNLKEYMEFKNKISRVFFYNQGHQLTEQYKNDFMTNTLVKYLQISPDEEIYTYLKARINAFQFLYNLDPSLILKIKGHYFFDPPLSGNENFLPFQYALDNTKIHLLKSASTNPALIPDENEFDLYFSQLIENIKTKYGQDIVTLFLNGKLWTLDNNSIALFTIDVLKEIEALGEHASGVMMRYQAHQDEIEREKELTLPVIQEEILALNKNLPQIFLGVSINSINIDNNQIISTFTLLDENPVDSIDNFNARLKPGLIISTCNNDQFKLLLDLNFQFIFIANNEKGVFFSRVTIINPDCQLPSFFKLL